MPALIHVRTPQGTAVCGQPALQANIQVWSVDITCPACSRLYAIRLAGKAARA